jgi:hypothetical protein
MNDRITIEIETSAGARGATTRNGSRLGSKRYMTLHIMPAGRRSPKTMLVPMKF